MGRVPAVEDSLDTVPWARAEARWERGEGSCPCGLTGAVLTQQAPSHHCCSLLASLKPLRVSSRGFAGAGSPQPWPPSPRALPAQGRGEGAAESGVTAARQRVLPAPCPIPLPGTLLTSLGWVGREHGQRGHVACLRSALLTFLLRSSRSAALGRRAAAVRAETAAGALSWLLPSPRPPQQTPAGSCSDARGSRLPSGMDAGSGQAGDRSGFGAPTFSSVDSTGPGAGSPAGPRRLGTGCHPPSLWRQEKPSETQQTVEEPLGRRLAAQDTQRG